MMDGTRRLKTRKTRKEADAWLVQACFDWDCPDYARVSVTFTT